MLGQKARGGVEEGSGLFRVDPVASVVDRLDDGIGKEGVDFI